VEERSAGVNHCKRVERERLDHRCHHRDDRTCTESARTERRPRLHLRHDHRHQFACQSSALCGHVL